MATFRTAARLWPAFPNLVACSFTLGILTLTPRAHGAPPLAAPPTETARVDGGWSPHQADAGYTIDSVALGSTDNADATGGVRVSVRMELLAEDSRTALNGRSADLLLDADCDGRRVRLRRVTVYRAPHQAGPGAPASAPPDWAPFSAHSYAAQIAEGICARRGELAAAAAPDGDAMSGVGSPAPPPTRPALAATAVAQDEPARAGDGVRSPVALPRAAPTAGAAAVAADVVKPGGTSPPPVNGPEAQFASSPSERDVTAAADRIRSNLSAEMATRTLTLRRATLNGRTWVRGRIGGFKTTAEARDFCRKVQGLDLPCLVFHGPAAP